MKKLLMMASLSFTTFFNAAEATNIAPDEMTGIMLEEEDSTLKLINTWSNEIFNVPYFKEKYSKSDLNKLKEQLVKELSRLSPEDLSKAREVFGNDKFIPLVEKRLENISHEIFENVIYSLSAAQ